MTFEIVSVVNKEPTADYYCWKEFHASLERFGVKPTILGMGEPWGGLITKPKTLQKYLHDGKCKADCLIVVDAWDLVFTCPPASIVKEWRNLGAPWIIGGERNLFPSGDESVYPECKSTYRFPNSGFIISTPDDMQKVLWDMDLGIIPNDGIDVNNWHPNDQFYYQEEFLLQPVPMRIDTETQFVWNLCGVDESNFDFGGPIPVNRETGKAPCAIHFNGGAKTDGMMDKILTHLGLR